MEDPIASNRSNWDERTRLHLASPLYDLDGFMAGTSARLPDEELEELGDVRGKTLLHLQCHFGLDSLSWARRGALVTGVDLSPVAIKVARELAERLGIDADFICADVQHLPTDTSTLFDIVYSTRGVLCWLADLSSWAAVIAHHLAPGGTFYLADGHPFLGLLADSGPWLDQEGRYFHDPEPVRVERRGSYTGDDPDFRQPISYQWYHHLGEVVTALADAGLVLDNLREFPWISYQALPQMQRDDSGNWRLPGDRLPLSFSLLAHRPT
jgi:SAM-dependent methyltransferase